MASPLQSLKVNPYAIAKHHTKLFTLGHEPNALFNVHCLSMLKGLHDDNDHGQ
jgi:hypothetical protein